MFSRQPKAIIPLTLDGESRLYEVYDRRNWKGEKYTEFKPVEDSKDATN